MTAGAAVPPPRNHLLVRPRRPASPPAAGPASGRAGGDTCICEIPTSTAICDWVIPAKNCSSRIRRSRSGAALSASRLSMPSNASSSAPSMSRTDGPSDSPPPGASRRGCCRASADSRPSNTSSLPVPIRSASSATVGDRPSCWVSAAVAEPIALENGRLQAELRANLDELRGSRARLIEAGQKERQRLERDLHDGAQQRLVALSLDFGVMETRLGDDPDATALLAKARDEVAVFIGRAARRRPRPAPSGGQRSASPSRSSP
jgi:signal transduction histidine kinase